MEVFLMITVNSISEEADVLTMLKTSLVEDFKRYHRITLSTIEMFKMYGFSENVMFHLFSEVSDI